MSYLGIDAGATATKWALYDGSQIVDSGKCAAMDGHIFRPESKARANEVLAEISKAVNGAEISGVFAGYRIPCSFHGFFIICVDS